MNRLRIQIPAFILTRTVLNTMHRMVYPFLAIFGRGLGIDLPALSLAVTARSAAGAFGPFLASIADSRGRKTGMLVGLLLFSAGTGLVVIRPTYTTFFLALILTVLGKYIFDPSMQAYLGDRVPYERRGLVMGMSEFSWSLSFIVGVPLMGFLIARSGWMAPFPLLCLLGLVAMAGLAWMLPKDTGPRSGSNGMWGNFHTVFSYPPALAGLSLGLLSSGANEIVNLVFGVWMEDSFGLKIAALGIASAVIGFSELGGESLVTVLTDRLGKPRAIGAGLILNSLAALALPFFGRTYIGALVGLFLFYITFEFTTVSIIPMMTEILPKARATLMSLDVAGRSSGRALGALIASPLYALGKSYDVLPAGLPGILACCVAAMLFNLLSLFALNRLQKWLGEAGTLQARVI